MIELTLPLPSVKLQPNKMVHRLGKLKLIAQARDEAGFNAIKQHPDVKGWSRAAIRPIFYRKQKSHFMDADNAIAWLKTTIDGLVYSGMFTDDKELIYLPVVQRVDKEDPRLVLQVTEVDDTVCPMCERRLP